MEEINLKELFNYYLKRIQIVLGITIIALLIGFIYVTELQVPMYHGTTTIILVQKQSEKDTSYAYQNELSINEKLVTTYSQIIKSRRVLEQVINNLKLKTTPKDLSEKINVEAVTDTSIIKVSVSDKDNKKAVAIANEVAKVFKKEVTNIYNLENVSIVDNAIIEEQPYNINLTKELAIAAAAGLIISCGLLFVVYYFDNTLKTKADVEDNIGLPVLSEIPTAKKITRINDNRGDR